MIRETCDRAERSFAHALRRIRKEESALPPRKQLPSARLDALIAKFDREIRELRASTRQRADGRATKTDALPISPHDAARDSIEHLERHLASLAEMRDLEADHAIEWERRAMMAVEGGDDALALEALSRKREHDRAHRSLAREHDYGVRVVALLREMFATGLKHLHPD